MQCSKPPVNHQTVSRLLTICAPRWAAENMLSRPTKDRSALLSRTEQPGAQNGLRFLYESTVMDGAPIFSLIPAALPAAEVRGFQGVLNSCTNLILERMEGGDDFEAAVDYAQQIGIAETDPTADVDGWTRLSK
jgi:homoserine dehydrogenase